MFKKLFFRYKFRIAKKRTAALCQKMLDLYNYFVATHPGHLRGSDSIKEVVPLVPGWNNVSRNVFKHKFGGIFEVKPGDNLEQIVTRMAGIEIERLAREFPGVPTDALYQEILPEIKDFFSSNIVR